jgi:plasmid maintenance system antidote protein VapI
MGMSAEFWRGVQADFDMARAYDTLAGEPAAIDPWQTQQFA